LSIYVDASALIPLFVPDALSDRASRVVRAQTDPLLVSDYAVLEFSAALKRMKRAQVLDQKTTNEAIAEFDAWRMSSCEISETTLVDIATAIGLARRDDLAFQASDAVNVAIAHRLSASLLTFDKKLASNARRWGLAVV
jgi:uncharacterized protein